MIAVGSTSARRHHIIVGLSGQRWSGRGLLRGAAAERRPPTDLYWLCWRNRKWRRLSSHAHALWIRWARATVVNIHVNDIASANLFLCRRLLAHGASFAQCSLDGEWQVWRLISQFTASDTTDRLSVCLSVPCTPALQSLPCSTAA